MRRLRVHLLLSGAVFALPGLAFAAPPSLPADDTADEPPAEGTPPADAPPADAPPGDGADAGADPGADAGAGGEAGAGVEGEAGVGGEVGVGGSLDAGLGGDAGGDLETGDDEILPGANPDTGNADEVVVSDGGDDEHADDPGYVNGRREPMMPMVVGPIGLYHTALPDAGGKYTFRFRLGTDFFRKDQMFCCDGGDPNDTNSRVRGGVNLGFTVAEWGEVYFNVRGSANRNERDQADREDPVTVFALGDMDFGFKGAWRGVKGGGVGVGGMVGLGLLSGSDRLLTERVNFNIDFLLAVDLRYLTAKHAPVRFALNAGWMLDNSTKLAEWNQIGDDLSRETLRYGLDVNHSRVRTRYAVDFPVRFGKDRKFGIDPFIEYSWDIATHEEPAFVPLTVAFGESPLPRSRQWLTIGTKANLYDGFFIDLGVDVGTVSPNFEYGPPSTPWQMILGLGWSFDPKPRIKEVEKEEETPPPPAVVLDGRILGRVIDSAGNPVANARVSFPGLTSNAILTDEGGMFTSYRFPEGIVQVVVTADDGTTAEQSVQVLPEQEAEVEIALEVAPAPADAVATGTVLGPDGAPLATATVHITGMGIDEDFTCCDVNGKFAVALPLGDYQATVSADGMSQGQTSFSVTAEGSEFSVSMASDKPPETPLVSGTKKSIRVRRGIRYSGESVHEKSHEGLDQLAAFLKGRPEYAVVEIRVHTDDRGNPRARSKARAESVRDYLITKGVDGSRLVAKGMGDSQPVAVNLTPEGRKKNNRTQLRVKDYKGE